MTTASEQPRSYYAYLRKSSEQEDRQMLSIPAQKSELEAIAKKEGLKIVAWFEESFSAKAPGRKVFNEMLDGLKRGKADGILTWSPNRLSRNSVDTGAIIYLLDLKELKEIRTMSQSFKNTPNDKFLFGLFCSQGKLENDIKGEDVTRGLKKKAEMGWLPSGAVIGYLNTPDRSKGVKVIIEDPERFPIVRRMWDLMLTGNYTPPQIWKLTHQWGLKTVQRGKTGGNLLSRSGVYAIFTNPFYYGWFEFPRGSGKWVEGAHKPMITKDEFERAQALMGRTDTPRPKEKHDFAFTGIMKCHNCGSSITAETKTKYQKNGNVHHYVYYHCTKRKDETCEEKSIELKKLNAQVDALLEQLTITEQFRMWAIKYVHEIRTTEAKSHEAALKTKHKELEETVEQLDSLMLKYTSPENRSGALISGDEMQSMKAVLLKRKSALEADLKVKGKEIEDWVVLTEKTFNFACYARIWFEKGSEDVRRAILACLCSNLLVKDRKIQAELRPYFQTITASKENLEMETASARTSENPYVERQKGTFVPSRPVGLRGQGSNLRPID